MSHSVQASRPLRDVLGDPARHTRQSIVMRVRDIDASLWQHARAVAESVAAVVAQLPDLTQRERQDIIDAAWTHDIGKLTIPREIFEKSSALTDPEWLEIKSHPTRGADYLALIPELRAASLLVRQHHERFDGAGYPAGLCVEQIACGARVIAIADAFDAMTSWRSYRPVLSHEQACVELSRCAGTQFDPDLVALFIRVTKSSESRTAG